MIENTREAILKHETIEYISYRPDWVVGKVPDLSDYRKLSVKDMKEAFTLARIGQEVGSQFLPSMYGEPTRLYFSQAIAVGAAVITRDIATKYSLDFEKYRSVLLLCPSRYGKSFLNALALIIMAGGAGKECNIGAATMPKAQIIQNKVVEMLPNTIPAVQNGLIVDSESTDKYKKIKRMATQTSKSALKWLNGGSIGMFSTNESQKNAEVAAAGAIGIGGDYCVFDELQLMTPVGFRTASRFMVEHPDTKRFCVANPLILGHLKELYDDPSTFVVHMNEVTAIIEKRFTRESIKLTGMPTYSAEYKAFVETEFPEEGSGTRFFPTMPTIYDKDKLEKPTSKMYFMGVDSAYQGGDSISVTILSYNQSDDKKWFVVEKQVDVKARHTNWGPTTNVEICLDILKLWEEYSVVAGAIDIGFGIHIYEKLRDLMPNIPLEPISYQGKPTEERLETDYNAKFAFNKRAELHMDLRDVCQKEMFYVNADSYEELVREMQEVGQSPAKQKIQIEPKKDIKARLGRSPDFLDSACLAVHAMVLSGVLGEEEQSFDYSQLMETVS